MYTVGAGKCCADTFVREPPRVADAALIATPEVRHRILRGSGELEFGLPERSQEGEGPIHDRRDVAFGLPGRRRKVRSTR